MKEEHIVLLLDETLLSLEELADSCTVDRDWIVRHVQAGVLLDNPDADPARWSFNGSDLLRSRRMLALERDFDANPELAGLVADLCEELERLRSRLKRAGLPAD